MGAFFSSFSGRVDVSNVFIDFEKAEPTDAEAKVIEAANAILGRGPAMLDALESYQNCGAFIRKALSSPSADSEREAFDAVKGNVALIAQFFEFSKEVANMTRELIKLLATGDDEKAAFNSNQSSVKKLAELLDFVLRFDELKMRRPGIQNDFSYYRRVLSKHSSDPDLVVRDDEASFISLYIAQPIPMMTSLAKAASKLYVSNPMVPQVLALMANVCLELVKGKKFDNKETNVLLVRVMVGAIVLYDHISLEGGAFIKKSGINIKPAVTLVVKEYAHQQSLVNMLRYSTLHYQDDSTPSNIRNLLESN